MIIDVGWVMSSMENFEQIQTSACPQTPSSSEQKALFRPVRFDYLFLTDRRTEMN